MSDFTFMGKDITDILVKCSKIDDPLERNIAFIEEFKAINERITETELGGIYQLLTGINYGYKLKENGND